MGPHQGKVEGKENLPRPAGHTPLDAPQDPMSFLGSQGTLLAQLSFRYPFLYPVFPWDIRSGRMSMWGWGQLGDRLEPAGVTRAGRGVGCKGSRTAQDWGCHCRGPSPGCSPQGIAATTRAVLEVHRLTPAPLKRLVPPGMARGASGAPKAQMKHPEVKEVARRRSCPRGARASWERGAPILVGDAVAGQEGMLSRGCCGVS